MKGNVSSLAAAVVCATNVNVNVNANNNNVAFGNNIMIPSVPIHSVDTTRTKTPTTTTTTVVDMPIIGIGTYKFKKGSGEASQAIKEAIRLGYRHIDTAFVYGGEQTEKEIGSTLTELYNNNKDSDVSLSRSDMFLTSKQWRAYHGYDATKECLQKSLKRLQTDYLDLYLIHWPGCAYTTMNRKKAVMEESPDGPFAYAKHKHGRDEIQSLRADTWRAMEDSLDEGKCRAIGVSNFTIHHLQALKQTARYWPPAVNQIELHPYNPQTQLVHYCRNEGIQIQAYASLGGQDAGKKKWNQLGGKLLERQEINSIAQTYHKTPAQVLLRWATQQGFSVIPKSSNLHHMRLNLEAVSTHQNHSFTLSPNDFKTIQTLDQSHNPEETRLCWLRDPLKMLDFD